MASRWDVSSGYVLSMMKYPFVISSWDGMLWSGHVVVAISWDIPIAVPWGMGSQLMSIVQEKSDASNFKFLGFWCVVRCPLFFFRHKHRNWGHRWCHGHCMYWINILHMRSDSYNVLDLKSRSSGKKIQETVIGCSVRRFSCEPEHPMNVVSWKLLTNNNPAVSSCYLGGNHHRPLNK